MKSNLFFLLAVLFTACSRSESEQPAASIDLVRKKVTYLPQGTVYKAFHENFFYDNNDSLIKIVRDVEYRSGVQLPFSYDTLIYSPGQKEIIAYEYSSSSNSYGPTYKRRFLNNATQLDEIEYYIYMPTAQNFVLQIRTLFSYRSGKEVKREIFTLGGQPPQPIGTWETSYRAGGAIDTIKIKNQNGAETIRMIHGYNNNIISQIDHWIANPVLTKKTTQRFSYTHNKIQKEDFQSFAPYTNDIDSVRYYY